MFLTFLDPRSNIVFSDLDLLRRPLVPTAPVAVASRHTAVVVVVVVVTPATSISSPRTVIIIVSPPTRRFVGVIRSIIISRPSTRLVVAATSARPTVVVFI